MPGGPLGTGTNRAYVYTKGGGTQLLPLDAAATIEWGRNRNAFSVSQVTVNADSDSFGQLGDVHTWAHELVVFRDGRRVWEGPIRYLDYGKSDTILHAVDVAGWMAKRRISMTRRLGEDVVSPVTTEMELSLVRAMADDDPNILAHRDVRHHAAETQISRDVRAGSGYYAGDFTGMAGKGAHFTVIGRRIVIWPDEVLIGRVDTLIPERDTTADVRVVENGDALATSATAVDADDRIRTSVSPHPDVNPVTAVSGFYGKHDATFGVEGSSNDEALLALGRAAVAQLFPAAMVIQMPADSRLLATAPYNLTDLVPGVVVPVETSSTPRRASASMILDSIKVAQSPEGEVITLTLAAASELVGGAA